MKSQKITRAQFAKIYKIACPGWKETLEQVNLEQLSSNEIIISDDLAKKIYQDATEEQRPILEKIVKKPESNLDKVKCYEDALKLNGDQCRIVKSDAPDEVAYKKLKAITTALNGGQVINKDYAMVNYYYANLFYFNSAGLGCVCSIARVTYTRSYYGFRHCFLERESAEYAAKQFIELYEQFYSA